MEHFVCKPLTLEPRFNRQLLLELSLHLKVYHGRLSTPTLGRDPNRLSTVFGGFEPPDFDFTDHCVIQIDLLDGSHLKRPSGIGPETLPWRGSLLPLHYRREVPLSRLEAGVRFERTVGY